MIKKLCFVFILLFASAGRLHAQTASVPDANFLSFLVKNYPQTINTSQSLIISEAAKISGKIDCSNSGIKNMQGIQYFTDINSLYANGNTFSSLPDISPLVNLQILHLEQNALTALPDLSALTNLQVLIVYENMLTSIQDLSKNMLLIQLIAYKNNISILHGISKLMNLEKMDISYNSLNAIPDLSNLTNLTFIDASYNNLATPPDISKNRRLTDVYLDYNVLTSGLSVTGLDSLVNVQLQQNFLSYRNFISYLSYPAYSAVFTLQPQKIFPGDTVEVALGSTLLLQTGVDSGLPNVFYDWYYNETLLKTIDSDSLIIVPAQLSNAGKYSCRIRHASFPGMELKTDTFLVKIISCPGIAAPAIQVLSGINCMNTGAIEVTNTSAVQDYNYTLTSSLTGKIIHSTTGKFATLSETNYTVIVSTVICNKTDTLPVEIPFEECQEVFITPNNDGDKENYFFQKSGKAVIYDKTGNIVNTLPIPALWDGSSKSGKMVAPGYYVAEVNGGEEYVMISVIY